MCQAPTADPAWHPSQREDKRFTEPIDFIAMAFPGNGEAAPSAHAFESSCKMRGLCFAVFTVCTLTQLKLSKIVQ